MKRLTYIALAIVFFIGTAITFDACKKDENEAPNSEESYDTFTDPRDGQTYNIVTIGSQTWFAENLNYNTGSTSCYDDDSNNCDVYGKLYKWSSALNACPEGWHLPSDNEWKILEMYLGLSQNEADTTDWRGTDEGSKMKEVGTTHWQYFQYVGGTNSSRFTALPGSYRDSKMEISTVWASSVTGGRLRGTVPIPHGAVACFTIATK